MDIHKFSINFWNNIASQDEEELRKHFQADACVRWHNTNEHFNVEEFLRANCDYPGSWNSEVERAQENENVIITVVHVWSKEHSFHVTSFYEMENDKIMALDEYWSEDGTAPQWRIDKHLGRPIR